MKLVSFLFGRFLPRKARVHMTFELKGGGDELDNSQEGCMDLVLWSSLTFGQGRGRGSKNPKILWIWIQNDISKNFWDFLPPPLVGIKFVQPSKFIWSEFGQQVG